MIELSPVLPNPSIDAPTPIVTRAAANARPEAFGQTFAAFLDARDAAATSPEQALGDLQELADDGKTLPEQADTDDQPDPAAPPVWFPTLAPLAAPNPPATPAGALPSTTAVAVPPALPMLRPAMPHGPVPAGGPLEVGIPVAMAAADDARATIAAAVLQPAASPSIDALIAAALERGAPPVVAGSPRSATMLPTRVQLTAVDAAPQAIAVTATPQPAGQVFAAAMVASGWHDRTDRSTEREPGDGTLLGGVAPLQGTEHAAVQATGDTGNTALDLTRDTGLQRMIDRIETLRDDASDRADSRDTRIRLVPDALGSVDIAVRQQGDRLHVHFTAERDATRALLAEAQPRLTELATGRGVRIDGSSVSSDSSGGNGATPQPRPVAPIARAPRATEAETDTPADARVA